MTSRLYTTATSAPRRGRYRALLPGSAPRRVAPETRRWTAELIILADQASTARWASGTRIAPNSLGDRVPPRCAGPTALQEVPARPGPGTGHARRRVDINPLQVLDDKRGVGPEAADPAPRCCVTTCATRARRTRGPELGRRRGRLLRGDPKLVRSLDYFTRTTFEFVHDSLDSHSPRGGRRRPVRAPSEMIGGPALPSVGWALGVDRTVPRAGGRGVELDRPATSVYAVPLGEEARRVLFAKVTGLRQGGHRGGLRVRRQEGLKGAMKRQPLGLARGRCRRARPREGRLLAQGHRSASRRPSASAQIVAGAESAAQLARHARWAPDAPPGGVRRALSLGGAGLSRNPGRRSSVRTSLMRSERCAHTRVRHNDPCPKMIQLASDGIGVIGKTTVNDVSAEARSGRAADAPRAVGGSRAFAILLVITGAAGLLAAWVITIDKFQAARARSPARRLPRLQPLQAPGGAPAAASWRAKQAAAFAPPTRCSAWSPYSIVVCVGMSLWPAPASRAFGTG